MENVITVCILFGHNKRIRSYVMFREQVKRFYFRFLRNKNIIFVKVSECIYHIKFDSVEFEEKKNYTVQFLY